MKYPLSIPRPRRADGTSLPAACAAALVAMLALQLAIPRAIPLPDPGVVRPFTVPAIRLGELPYDPVVLARPIFGGGAGAAASSVPRGPMDGAAAVGIMSQRGGRIAFVQGADGKVVSLRPGGLFHGWRLGAIGSDALVFRRADKSVTLPVIAQGALRPALAPSAMTPVVTAPANIPSGSPLVQPRG